MLRTLRHPRSSVAAWVAMFALIAYGSLLPARELPDIDIHGFDKLEHAVGYALLSGYSTLLFATRKSRVLACMGVIGFGIVIELAQGGLTSTREADPSDVVANTVGALAGQLMAFTRMARWLEHPRISDAETQRPRRVDA